MVKKLLLALVGTALVFGLVACDSSANYKTAEGTLVHWWQNDSTLERKIQVQVPASVASNATFLNEVKHGVGQLNRSPYIHATLKVSTVWPDACATHCITINRKPLNGGVASLGWDPKGHIYGRGCTIWIDSGASDIAFLHNAIPHELFHCAGLDHSPSGHQGPVVHGIATDLDLQNVANAHNHKDNPIYAGTTMLTANTAEITSKLKWKTHSHTHEFYRNLGRAHE